MADLKVVHNTVVRGEALRREEEELVAEFGREVAEGVLAYHRTMPGYQPTPLHDLTQVQERIKYLFSSLEYLLLKFKVNLSLRGRSSNGFEN